MIVMLFTIGLLLMLGFIATAIADVRYRITKNRENR